LTEDSAGNYKRVFERVVGSFADILAFEIVKLYDIPDAPV
jgi:hypothetical protein